MNSLHSPQHREIVGLLRRQALRHCLQPSDEQVDDVSQIREPSIDQTGRVDVHQDGLRLHVAGEVSLSGPCCSCVLRRVGLHRRRVVR